MHWRRLAFTLFLFRLSTAHLITSPASLPRLTPTGYPSIGAGHDELYGRLPGHQLFKRASIPCDGNSFWCPTGTCFTAVEAPYSGLIGCCNAASYAPRTECVPYSPGVTSPCDVNTGGCTYCSDSETPACLTMTNVVDGQWILYCAAYPSTETVSYTPSGSDAESLGAGGSTTAAVTSSFGQASFSPVPGMQVRPSTIISTEQPDSSTGSVTITTGASSSGAPVPGTTYISACVSNVCGSASVQPASLISSLPNSPSSTVTVSAVSGSQASQPSGTSGGLVAGVVVGAVAACALLIAGLLATKRHWLACFGRAQESDGGGSRSEKLSTDADTPPGTGKAGDAVDSTGTATFHSPNHIPRHAELDGRTGSVSAERSVDAVDVRGLGIAGISQRRYAPTNPDPTSAIDEGNCPTDTAPPAGLSEAPGDRQLPASPAVSSLALPPDTPSISNNTPGSPSAVSPNAPSYKHTSVPYTPSAYAYEPPSSIPRTVPAAPPSMPQDYSLVSLGSSANIYRGLSQRGGAPWAYLSPEEAVRGGWRNGEDVDGG